MVPSSRSRNVVDLKYAQKVDYLYTALVKPSLTYENRSEISVGDPLYTNLVKQLNITLRYNFTHTTNPLKMTNASISYEVKAVLNGGDWNKTYLLTPRRVTSSNFTETYVLIPVETEKIVARIYKETGVSSPTYTYEIRPQITLEASAEGKPVAQDFEPVIKIKFEGYKITIEGADTTKSGTITHLETESATWAFLGYSVSIETMRILSLLASVSLVILLIVSARFMWLERASKPFLSRLSDDVW
jgi:hypothetical protein